MQVLYTRFLYFLFPKKITELSKTRESLSCQVHEFIDKHISEVDPKYKEDRILFREAIVNERDYLFKRNIIRKISKESEDSIKVLFKTIS